MIRVLLSLLSLVLSAAIPQAPAGGVDGCIHGRVTERETGKPVAGISVGLVQKSYSRDGVPEPALHASAETDENGAYTLRCAAAGSYYIATGAQAVDDTIFIPQYFPAASDISSAIRVTVPSGAEVRDVNITVTRGKRVSIRGELTDALARRLPHWDWVTLTPRNPLGERGTATGTGTGRGSTASRRHRYDEARRYELSGVLPGPYYLTGWRFDDFENRTETVIPIDVRDSDLEIEIVSELGYRLNGRVRFEAQGFSAPQPNVLGNDVQLILRPLDGSPLSTPGLVLNPTGTFSFAPLPAGLYRLSILGLPAPFYVRAARFGTGPDLMDRGIALPASGGTLDVILASDGGEIHGLVREGSSSTIVLIPQVRPLLRPDLYKVAEAGKDGTFTIGGIAPGGYRAYAWDVASGNEFFDAHFMTPFESLGTEVNVAAGKVTELVLPLLKRPVEH